MRTRLPIAQHFAYHPRMPAARSQTPLVIGIAIVYKALKTENLARLPAEAIRLTLYIHLFMIIIAAMLWLLVEGVERL